MTRLQLLGLFAFALLLIPAASAYTYYGSDNNDYSSYSYSSQKVSGDAYGQYVKTVDYDKNTYSINQNGYKETYTSVNRVVKETEQPAFQSHSYNDWRPVNYYGKYYGNVYSPNAQPMYVNTYNTPYYYQPRWDSYNQNYNWHSY